MDDFSNHPPSIGETRADRSGDGSLWSPREVLVAILRDIDGGKIQPDVLVVAWGEVGAGKRQGHFNQSTHDGLLSLGLMQATIFKMQD
jgi:hypothetical protein